MSKAANFGWLSVMLLVLLCPGLTLGQHVGVHRHGLLIADVPSVYAKELFVSLSGDTSLAQQSAEASLDYLKRVMDQFHDRFPVYEDVSSAGNHFHAWAKIPDGNAAVEINGSFTSNPHSGATSIRCKFINIPGKNFGGFYFLNGILPSGALAPLTNFGTVPNAGVDLSGTTDLTFWARGERGGEKIEFFMGGVGRNPETGMPESSYPDSARVVKISVMLTNQWIQYHISLSGRDLSYVLGGFGWVADDENNPNGATFYLDDIQYELSSIRRAQRLNEPRFLRSFTTKPFQVQPSPVDDFDLVLRNLAFTYDNALALLAFLADGTEDGLRRAKLIGNAFVYASQHDRSFDDGRLRTAYAAGDISLPPGWTPNGRLGTVPSPGFFDEDQQRFFEVEQGATDVGSNAWGMIALLGLFRRTNEPVYLKTARRIGEFIRTCRNDTGQFQGFQGGLNNPESPIPIRRLWASTEHNLDVYAAFTAMFEITGESQWQTDAWHGRQFVEAMWDSQRGCYLAGTKDPTSRNKDSGQLPLDTQSWSVLALPDVLTAHPQVLACAEQNHRTTDKGFSGFDFNEDRDGVWFEGTAQMAVAYALAGQFVPAEGLLQALRGAQQTPPFGNSYGLVAASHEGVSTGFGFKLFQRLHVGATSWNVFAQRRFNPFYQSATTIEALFESPEAGPVSSVAVIRGWAFATQAGVSIRKVELFIDGVSGGDIPCCSDRADVQAAFPQFPVTNTLNSGWGTTFNWGVLNAGSHTVQVVIKNTLGETLATETRTITVIKPGNLEFLDRFSLAGATARIEGDQLVVEGAVVRDKASQQQKQITARFRWFTSSQSLQTVEAVTIGTASSGQSFFSGMFAALSEWFLGLSSAPTAQASPGIVRSFESPEVNQVVSGVAVIRGWAFTDVAGASLTEVRLVIDGMPSSSIPCCSARGDVAAAFPTNSNALNSGWGFTINYGNLPVGFHNIGIRLSDSVGASVTDTHGVTVVKVGGFAFLDQFNLAGATVQIQGEEIVLSGVQVRDKASQQTRVVTVRLRWLQSAQALGIVAAG